MQSGQKDNQEPSHELEIKILTQLGFTFEKKPVPKQQILNNVYLDTATPTNYRSYHSYKEINLQS
jgi:hypothetical protein